MSLLNISEVITMSSVFNTQTPYDMSTYILNVDSYLNHDP